MWTSRSGVILLPTVEACRACRKHFAKLTGPTPSDCERGSDQSGTSVHACRTFDGCLVFRRKMHQQVTHKCLIGARTDISLSKQLIKTLGERMHTRTLLALMTVDGSNRFSVRP